MGSDFSQIIDACEESARTGLHPGIILMAKVMKEALANAYSMHREVSVAEVPDKLVTDLKAITEQVRRRSQSAGCTKSDLRDMFVLAMRKAAEIAESADLPKPVNPNLN